jgi:acyl-CoA synthetase (AMP-forming)/AMP-acid ligase II
LLASSIRGAAERFGDRPALIAADGAVTTFAELDAWSDRVAAWLVDQHGVGEGTVVGLVLPSTPPYVAAYLALAKLGAVTAGVNPRFAPAEKAAVLERLGADLVLDAIASTSRPLLRRELPDDPDRPVAIVFTSGSTGVPKGAVFCERQLRAIVELDVGSLDVWGTGGPMLSSTQFPHVGFMTKLPWYLRLGCTLLLQDRWQARRTLELVAEHRVSSLGGVAAQIGLLLRVPDFDAIDVSCVETIVVGAGPSPAPLVRDARRRFGAGYSIRYSSTESGGVGTATSFEPDEDEIHTVGAPRPGVEVRIDADSNEVLLRSPAVMSGYWRDAEQTAQALNDEGWLRTGDLGAIDDDGRLRLIGRTTDMYIRGGYNVHPQEVEAVLLEHPSVADIAVAARPDDVMGEVGVAIVVVARDASPPTAEDLRSFAGERLASYKLPEDVVVVDALPLTSMDKLDRRQLAVLAGGR